jgi:subtilisin family serine protease
MLILLIQALNWAVESAADIISLSASFFIDDPALETAIKNAIAADIVVIASTAGEGYNEERAYPAKYDSVLKIAAADYMGKETRESLSKNADYMFPGENILAKTTFLGADASTDPINGMSVATAIAAGVSSLILTSHRFKLSTQALEQPWKDHKKLKRSIITKTLAKMIDNEGKYVKPRHFFKEDEYQPSWGEAGSVIKWMQNLNFS